jgi:2-dehydropantoate 2-reductase
VVLFGVKLWDTAAAAEAIKPLIGEDTAVVLVPERRGQG